MNMLLVFDCAAVPTKFGPEVVCSSVSELVRMAAAALISLYVYLNFKQGPNDLAAGGGRGWQVVINDTICAAAAAVDNLYSRQLCATSSHCVNSCNVGCQVHVLYGGASHMWLGRHCCDCGC
jgi:hypothetical protein